MKLLRNFFTVLLRFVTNHKWWSAGIIILVAMLIYFLRPKPLPQIATATVQREHFVQSVSVSGSIQAKNFADLNFLAGGKLVYLGVKKGDYVNQYQTIAVLDERTAQANLQSALLDYSKQRNTFDQTQDNYQNRKPVEALNDAMKRVLQNNQYDLDKAVNSVELQDLAKQNSVLTSPISGIVTRADVNTAGVNVGPTTTFSIVDPNSLVFNMDVDEADIGKVSIGQTVHVNLDAYPDKTWDQSVDTIDFVSHATNTGGTAYTVQVKIPTQPGYEYKVGMNGNGEIITHQKDNVISIPQSAIADNTYVYVKASKGFEKRNIKIGLQNDTNAEVVSGLTSGEKIALDPVQASKAAK